MILSSYYFFQYCMIQTNPIQAKDKKHYQLETKSLMLKPYKKAFVKQYHSWFQNDQQLLYLTGSQSLSLQEEYENHKSWITDPNKYTFIIFSKGSQKQQQVMIGDVNLFFSEWIEPNQAEINVMIARKQFRGKGFAKETMQIIQTFLIGIYKKDTIIAKIKDDNIGSIKLFEKIGYKFINHNESFHEVEYRKKIEISTETAYNLLQQNFHIKEIKEQEIIN